MTLRPQRIVHASGFTLRAKGSFQHGVPHKISNGLVRNGHQVINFCDREVASGAGWLGVRSLGRQKANTIFLEFCEHVAPEGILLGHADLITADTVRALRQRLPDVRVLQWNVDPLFDEPNARRIEDKLDVVDATLISTAGDSLRRFWRPGKRLGFLPNPSDPSIERGHAYARDDLAIDLFFAVGSPRDVRHYCGRGWNVEELGALIRQRIPELRTEFPGMFGTPPIVGGTFQRALEASRMGLNISKRNDVYLYSSNRIAHLMGNGVLTFIDRATGYAELLGEDAAVFHSEVEELIDKLRHFHGDDASRRTVARRGAERYRALFNERIVARYIADVLFDRLESVSYEWPTLFSPAALRAALPAVLPT
jgi:hypothetical protein